MKRKEPDLVCGRLRWIGFGESDKIPVQ